MSAMSGMIVTEAFNLWLSSHYRAAPSARSLTVCSASGRRERCELHVCTNKTCKKQGSKEVSVSPLLLSMRCGDFRAGRCKL